MVDNLDTLGTLNPATLELQGSPTLNKGMDSESVRWSERNRSDERKRSADVLDRTCVLRHDYLFGLDYRWGSGQALGKAETRVTSGESRGQKAKGE